MFQLCFMLLMAAGSCLAMPSNSPLGRRYEWPLEMNSPLKFDGVCGVRTSDSDPGMNSETWYKSGAALKLEAALIGQLPGSKGYENWVRELDQNIWGTTSSPSWDCATIGGTCGPVASCQEFFDQGYHGEFYWIFLAVTKINSIFTYLHTQLQDSVLLNALKIDEVIGDFGEEPKGIDGWGFAAAAFSVSAGITDLAGPEAAVVGQGLTMASTFAGSMGAAAAAKADAEPKPDEAIRETLGNYFEASKLALEDTLRNALGEGNQEELPESGFAGPVIHATQVTRFFGAGKFLVDSVDGAFRAATDHASVLLRQAIAIRALSASHRYIWINTDITRGEDCNIGRSGIWYNSMCWGIYEQPGSAGRSHESCDHPGQCAGDRSFKVDPISDEMAGKMLDDYQFEIFSVYQNAWDCKHAHPEGPQEVDAANLPYDGTYPLCFYNIDVIKASFDKGNGKFRYVDL